MAGLKLTPIILKEVNKYLTTPKKVRKFGFDDTTVKTGEDIERPQEALDREMFKDAEERFNKADGGRIEFSEAGLAKQKAAAEKYGMSLKKYQSLPQKEKIRLKDKAKREALKAKFDNPDGLRVSKNIRKLPNNTFKFETEAAGNRISKTFKTLKEAEDFRDKTLLERGIEKGKFKKGPNPKRGKYEGVKGQKHIKFNGVTYQVAVQRMKDKKMVTEKPFYTTSLEEAKKVRDERVAKSPPKVEKGVVRPDREKIQRKIDKRKFVQKTKEGRTGIKFLASKGYQVHHLLPLSLAGPDTNTRDLAVISAQMNREMAQFDKPIKKLTEDAFLLDYNGDRKNSLKKLKEINQELNDIVKKGVKKLGPEYKGLIGFNEIIPIPDENGQIFSLDFKPVGVDFKKSIAKNIKVPEKVKKLSTPELQKLVAEAPKTDLKGERGSIDRQLLADVGKFAGRAAQAGFLTPTGVAASTLGLGGLDLTSPVGRIVLGAELAGAPELVKASIGATKGIKNRALQKGIQQFLNLGLPTRLALKAARVASPLGIALTTGEGLYQAGKFAKKRMDELQAMSPEQRQALRARQAAFAFEGAREGGIIGKKSGPPPVSGPTPHGLPYETKGVKKS